GCLVTRHDRSTHPLQSKVPTSPRPEPLLFGEWELVVGTRTDPGRARSRNEDSVYAEPSTSTVAQAHGWVAIVADGVGGRQAGDIASRIAVRVVREAFYSDIAADPRERLRSAITRANDEIRRAAQASSDRTGMASTITAAIIRNRDLLIAQVGDSRAYLIRDGQIRQLTRDHSLVGELIRSGDLTPEEARIHPQRNVVTRLLGAARVEPDLIEEQLRADDVLLLCTDGLHGLLDD